MVAKGSFLMGLLTEEPKGLLQPVNQDVFRRCSRLKCALGREGHQIGSAQQDVRREEENSSLARCLTGQIPGISGLWS